MSPLRRSGEPKPPAAHPDAAKVSVGIARLRGIAARRAEEGLNLPAPAELRPATRDAYEEAVSYLQDQAVRMSEMLADLGEDAPAVILKETVNHMNWLCDHLAANGDDSDAALARGRDTAYDAADLVQLMQMERRDSAAIEALSLMLQVKRELEADLAA